MSRRRKRGSAGRYDGPEPPKGKKQAPPTKRQLAYIAALADQVGEEPPRPKTHRTAATAIRCLRVKAGLPADDSPKARRRPQPILVTRADGSTDVVGPGAFRRKPKARSGSPP